MWHSYLDHGDPSVLGHQLPQSQEIWPYQSLSSLWKLVISKPLWLVLLCCLAGQELKRPVSLESFSIVGLSLLFSCHCWCVGRERAMVMAAHPTCDSGVSPCLRRAWFSSTGISHGDPLPHVPSGCIPAIKSMGLHSSPDASAPSCCAF